ncbi:MAG: hypothetical protein JXA53_12145 [Bacteroidales bacterium]|nr:hypothetical protein [Bacteroidales bacterium]
MNAILNRDLFFVKEHVGMFKAANNYDILDPETNQTIINCREDNLGFFTKMLRFTKYKIYTPFNVNLKTTDNQNILTIKRGVSFFISKVDVYDENNVLVGKFKQKFFSLGGKFDVLDANDNYLCTLKGKWTSWDFKFIRNDIQYAQVNKKWAGMGKELFTTADNYMLQINDNVPHNSSLRLLIVAAVMCIDMVLKE